MATPVVIKFIGDTSDLEPAVNQLASIGGIDQKVADTFKANNAIFKERIQALSDTKTTADASGKSVDALSNSFKNLNQTAAIGSLKTDWDNFNNSLGNSSGKVASLVAQFRQVRNEIATMIETGNAQGPMYDAAIEKASQLKQAITNANKELEITGARNSGLQALTQSMTGVVGAFSLGQGAIALFGSKNKDLEETLIKVQGAMLVLNGLQSISNTLTDLGAIKAGLYSGALKLLGLTEEEFAAISATTWAIATAGITLLIGGIIALVVYFDKISEALGGTSRAQRAFNDVQAEGAKNSTAEIQALNETFAAANNKKLSIDQQAQALDELNKKYPELFANFNKETIGSQQAKLAIDQLTDSIIKQANLKSAQDKLVAAQAAVNETIAQGAAAQVSFWDKMLTPLQKNAERVASGTHSILDGLQKDLTAAQAAFNQALLDNNNSFLSKYNAQKEQNAKDDQEEVNNLKANIARAKANTIELLNEQIDLIDQQAAIDKQAALDKEGNTSLYEAEVRRITDESNAQKNKLQYDFYSKQKSDAAAFHESMLNIEKGLGVIGTSSYNQADFDIKKKEFEDKITLANKYNQDASGLQTSLNNLIASRDQQLRDEQQKARDVDYQTQELDLKASYDSQLALLENTGAKTKDEILKNNVDKLNLERNYQDALYQIQLKAAQDKLATIPQFETKKDTKGNDVPVVDINGLQVLTTEYKAQLNVIEGITNTHNETQNANQKKANDLFLQITQQEFQDSLRLSDEYFDEQKKKATDAFLASQQSPADIKNYQEKIKAIDKDSLDQRFQIFKDYGQNTKQVGDQIAQAEIDKALALAERKKQIEQQLYQTLMQIQQEAFQFFSNLIDAQAQAQVDKVNQAETANEAALKNRLDAGLIDQKQYDTSLKQLQDKQAADVKKIQHDQAVKQKELSEFQIILNTAEAVVKTYSEVGFPLGIPLAVAIAALGAAQLAVVASKPIPLARGTESVEGGQPGIDSVHALLMPKERVVPADINQYLKGIPNAELPRLAMLNEMFSSIPSIIPDGVIYNGNNNAPLDYDLLGRVISEQLKDQFRKIPINNISLDKDGFNLSIQEGSSRTNLIANRYTLGNEG